MGLRYWDLTPDEMALHAYGHAKRQAREWYRTAWGVSYILGGLIGKKAPKPEQLVGAETMRLIRPIERMPVTEDDE